MFLLPFERLNIATPLSSAQVCERLAKYIDVKSSDPGPYWGSLRQRDFKIRRVIHYRNGLLPVITGRVLAQDHGSSLRITMRPMVHPLVVLVLIVSICLYLGIRDFWAQPQVDQIPSCFGIPFLMYVFCLTLFKVESVPSKSFFRELFPESNHGAPKDPEKL